MEGYTASTYGDRWAEVYDEWYPHDGQTDVAAATLADLAHGAAPGRTPVALELGVGTGTLALAVAAHGIDVRGIDASAAMLDRLRDRPGAERLAGRVAVGDVAIAPLTVPGEPVTGIDLVYASRNTLCSVADEGAQRDAVAAAAAVLGPDGRLVVEVFVPDDALRAGQPDPPPRLAVRSMSVDSLVLTADRVDAAAQRVDGQFVELRHGQPVRLLPFRVRYLFPEQLDELARAAGLTPVARWGGWDRRPFTADTATVVAVYAPG